LRVFLVVGFILAAFPLRRGYWLYCVNNVLCYVLRYISTDSLSVALTRVIYGVRKDVDVALLSMLLSAIYKGYIICYICVSLL
jgi:hypothetical protein